MWVNKTIDREILESNVIRLVAVATSDPLAPIEIEINVLDVNDNAPVFTPASTALKIPESTGIGTLVSGIMASIALVWLRFCAHKKMFR